MPRNGIDFATIYYLYERYDVDRLVPYNLPVSIQDQLKLRGVKIERVDYKQVLENDLVIVCNLSQVVEPDEALKIVTDLSAIANLMIVYDETVVFAGPTVGFVKNKSISPWSPFGLMLPFSLWDRKLISWNGCETQHGILAIISCYNEVDIIHKTVDKLVEQSIIVHIFDNWSTDGTWEELKKIANDSTVKIERFPKDGPDRSFNLSKLLSHTEEIASAHPNKWIIHMDADEIRRPPWPLLNFKQSLGLAEFYGSNAVDFTVINFRPIDNTWTAGLDPEYHFKYCEFGSNRDAYTRQIKMWKQGEQVVSLAETAGHEVRFNGRRLFPYKFVLKHYPIRSTEHGIKKLTIDRLPRFNENERKMGWHTHYDVVRDKRDFTFDQMNLIEFNPTIEASVGLAVITGLPPGEISNGELMITDLNVYVPYETLFVIDLPDDLTISFGIARAISKYTAALRYCFKSFKIVATNEQGCQLASKLGLNYSLLDYNQLINGQVSAASKGYALAEYIRQNQPKFVFSLLCGGITGASLQLRDGNVEFQNIIFIGFLTGGSLDYLHRMGLEPFKQEHIEVDYLEQLVASKSDFIIDRAGYLREDFFVHKKTAAKIIFLPTSRMFNHRALRKVRVNAVAFYGPLTGSDFEAFLKSIPGICNRVSEINFHFIGPFGWVYGEHSGGYLVRFLKKLNLNFEFSTTLEQHLASIKAYESPLYVVPDYADFTAEAIDELLERGLPFIVNETARTSESHEITSNIFVQFSKSNLEAAIMDRFNTGAIAHDLNNHLNMEHVPSPLSVWASSLYGYSLRKSDRSFDPIQANPLVAVCIPHYERPELLIECLRGFNHQTYTNFYVMIIDDGSKLADTDIMLENAKKAFPRLNLEIIYQANSYLGAARNNGFLKARGRYVIFFDDDDFPLPNYIESLVVCAETSAADVVTTSLEFWDGSDSADNRRGHRASHFPIGPSVAAAFGRNSLGSAAIMVRRTAFENETPYTTDYGLGWEDYEFSYKAVLTGKKFVLIPKAMYLYRVNSSGMSAMAPTVANGARLWRGIENLIPAAEMAKLLRVQFYERIWNEDKTNKWAWLHNLGSKTPLYHRLLEEPFNSPDIYSLLANLRANEESEGRSAIHDSPSADLEGFKDMYIKPEESGLKKTGEDLMRLFNYGKILVQMERFDAASQIFEVIDTRAKSSFIPALLGRCWLEVKAGRYSDSIATLNKIISNNSQATEALYALWQLSRIFKDEVAQRGALEMLERQVAEDYKERNCKQWPAIVEYSTKTLLEHWAIVGRNAGKELTSFLFFNDVFSDQVVVRFGDWRKVVITRIEVLELDIANVAFRAEQQMIEIHPPVSTSPTEVHLVGERKLYGTEVRCHAETPDSRAVPVELGIFASINYSKNSSQSPSEVNVSCEGIADRRNAIWRLTSSECPFPFLTFAFPTAVNFSTIGLLCRNARRDADNSYATTYVREIYVRCTQ